MKYTVTFIINYAYDIYSENPLTEEEVVQRGLDFLEDDTNSTWYDEYYIEEEKN